MEIKHYNISISGYVQGVNFRTEAKQTADQLGICGFAQNLQDKSVYIEAEGEIEALKKFVAWCEQGPWGGEVDDTKVEEGPIKGYDKFNVKYRNS